MRKVFLDDLPQKDGVGANKGKQVIDWKNSIGVIIGFVYDDVVGEIQVVDYTSRGQYLTIKYQGKEFKIKSDSFKRCKIGSFLNKYTSDFKIEIGKCFKDSKRDMVIIDREYRMRNRKDRTAEKQKWYKYKCNKCGWNEGWIEESKLYKGKGCGCCSGTVVVAGINDVGTTDSYLLKYFLDKMDSQKYTRHSLKRVIVKCPDCGREKNVVVSDLVTNKSICCSCGDGFSYGHKYIYNLLTQLEINFIDNYRPEWCKYYNKYKNKNTFGEYDFIIDNMKLIIEVDGEFHRKDNKMNGQTKEESKYIDNIKDKLAKENGYSVIRLVYETDDFKENILNSELARMFNLRNIDWIKCEEFSNKNIVKEVCDYWNDKKEYETTTDLGVVFNLHRDTIRSYLKRGSFVGLCKYNAKEEVIKNNKSNGLRVKNKSNNIEVFKQGKSLGEFKSVNELVKESQLIFGVTFLQSAISGVCTGRYTQYKGFTFKYIE